MLIALGLFVGQAVVQSTPAAAGSRADAQRSLDAAARELSAAETELAHAQTAAAKSEGALTSAEKQLARWRGVARDEAVRRYVQGDVARDVMLTLDVSNYARAQVLVDVVSGRVVDAGDELSAAVEDVKALRDVSTRDQAALRQRVAGLEKRRAAAAAELDRIAAEEDALALAERQAAAERAAAARRKAASGNAKQPTAKTAASRAGGDADPTSVSPTPTPTSARPAPTTAEAAAPETSSDRPTGVIASGSWVCPVQGARSFTNDWGAARAGGRAHQGTDLLSPRGTPVVANVSGTFRQHTTSALGGLAYYLKGDDGATYYGAHLNGYSGVSGYVTAGTVIGYVGNTGDARWGPTHLHFEMHPGGGGAVNPYPTLSVYC